MTNFTILAQSFTSAARITKVVSARDEASALLVANREIGGDWYVISISH